LIILLDDNLSTQDQICPYLGLLNDQNTHVGYPSPGNICYRVQGKVTPNLDYQRHACLTPDYLRCPIYNNPGMTKMPKSLRHQPEGFFSGPKGALKIFLLLLLTIIVILGVINFNAWFKPLSNWFLPSWERTSTLPANISSPTIIVNPGLVYNSPTPTTPPPTATPMPTATATIEPSLTPEPIVLALDTPIGDEIKFVMHRAAPGESPGQYATQYNTTVQAFFAVNYDMPSVLYVNRVVVIPVDIRDVSGLPAFEVYQVRLIGQTVEELAEQLSVDIDDFRLYNNLPVDYTFERGDWVLVPRS
jgi:hypothetical protein